MTQEKKLGGELIIDIIAWIVAIGVFALVWNFTLVELVRSGEETGVRNKLFEFIWPIVLGFLAGGGSHWATNTILGSIFLDKNKK